MKRILLLFILLITTAQTIQSQTVVLDTNGVTVKWTGTTVPSPYFVQANPSGLSPIVYFVTLGFSSRFNKLRSKDHLKPKLRAVMKNNSPFLLSTLPIFTRSLITFVRAT